MRSGLGICVLALALAGCPADPAREEAKSASVPARGPFMAPEGKSPAVERAEPKTGPGPAQPELQPEDRQDQLQALRARGKVIQLSIKGIPLEAYVADSDPTRRVGLMHVKSLPAETGMLFVYPEAKRGIGFWMRNTLIPLSLAYVRDDGTIDQLLDMKPLDETTHRSSGFVRFVLEVNLGWFRRKGIKVGDKIAGIVDLEGS